MHTILMVGYEVPKMFGWKQQLNIFENFAENDIVEKRGKPANNIKKLVHLIKVSMHGTQTTTWDTFKSVKGSCYIVRVRGLLTVFVYIPFDCFCLDNICLSDALRTYFESFHDPVVIWSYIVSQLTRDNNACDYFLCSFE